MLEKDHRSELKAFKKKLGQANSKILKLEKDNKAQEKPTDNGNFIQTKQASQTEPKLVDPEDHAGPICSICACVINNYTPRYFMGSPINPACERCDDCEHKDPFSSFSLEGVPPSLVSHWNTLIYQDTITPLVSSRSHIVDQHQLQESATHETFVLDEEMQKWSDIFQKNLEDKLKKWDTAFTNMEKQLDKM